jgi:ABC-2 type transport system permease protein
MDAHGRQVSYLLLGDAEFSPVMFPAGQLPGWLVQVNRWLPCGPMATVMRSALLTGVSADVGRAYLVLAAWAVLSGLVASVAVGHRR